MDPKGLDEVRRRSVDNLQRLYTVVISLAVTEALRRTLLGLSGDDSAAPASVNQWLMLLSLIVTIVPFYHGANRYLDATYVTKERSAKSNVLMVDFLFLFLEGATFFALAMLIKRVEAFYTVLALLLIFDALWVLWTSIPAVDEPEGASTFGAWAIINVVAAATMSIFFSGVGRP